MAEMKRVHVYACLVAYIANLIQVIGCRMSLRPNDQDFWVRKRKAR